MQTRSQYVSIAFHAYGEVAIYRYDVYGSVAPTSLKQLKIIRVLNQNIWEEISKYA